MNMRRCLSFVLLVFVCLFALFSHLPTVYASDEETYISTFFGKEVPLKNDTGISLLSDSYGSDVDGYAAFVFYLTDDGNYVQCYDGDSIDVDNSYNVDDNGYLTYLFRISLPETISKGTVFDLTFSASKTQGQIAFIDIYAADADNNYTYNLNFGDMYKNNEGANKIYFSFKDVCCSGSSIGEIYLKLQYQNSTVNHQSTFSTRLLSIDISEVSQNGLLNSIIDIIKNIWTGITDLPQNIANSIKGFFENVVNAVVNLGNTLLEGIKNLFVPSEDDITTMKEKWDTLLSERFGALYQVTQLIHDYALAFKNQNKSTITFPSVTIPLAGSNFTFGGWEVQIVPDGFSAIFTVLKTITSILATCLFVNSLRNRFEKILGGADDV